MSEKADTTNDNPDNPAATGSGTEATQQPGAVSDDAANGVQPVAPAGGNDGTPNEGGDAEGLDFQFGDEAPPASGEQDDAAAPQWIKDLRKDFQTVQRRNRELEAQLQQKQPQAPAVPTLGNRPKLEDFDYDEGKYTQALDKWFDDKRKVDAAQDEQRKAGEARQKEVDTRRANYLTEAQSLKRKDFQDVESAVTAVLSQDQQGILLLGAARPAALIYTLGRYPTKLRELAAITNPVQFAFAASKLEKDLKVTSRTANKAAPEGRVESSSGSSAAGGSQRKLEQLRTEAEKTGDYSKVHAYKRQLKAAERR
jgi:hypothetical protein